MKRDYVKEIIDILEKYDGYVTGFNNLQKLGNFHRTALAEYLRAMEDQNLIKVIKISKQVKRYCLPGLEFRKAFQLRDLELKAVKKELDQNNLSKNEKCFLIRNHIRLGYHNFIINTVMYLYAKYERKDNDLTADLDRKRKKIWNEIEKMVSKLPRDEKTRLWRAFLKHPPKISSLDEYRKLEGMEPDI